MHKHFVMIAAIGYNFTGIQKALRELPFKELILLIHKKERTSLQQDLDGCGIPIIRHTVKNYHIEEIFEAISKISLRYPKKEILINGSSGSKELGCTLTCAGYAHGLRVFHIGKRGFSLLPYLKFSYYRQVTEKKKRILYALQTTPHQGIYFDKLCKELRISPPLLSYHIHGNLKTEGLLEMGLVDTHKKEEKLCINLSVLGRLLMNEYVEEHPSSPKYAERIKI